MNYKLEQPRFRNVYLLTFLIVLSSCAGPKIAVDQLANAKKNEKPLTNSTSIVNVTINPLINNREKLDESVKQSLKIALANANIFGKDSIKSYKIDANISVASQAPASFGNFEGTLEIHYVVHDINDVELLYKKIYTVAGSDKWYFVATKRHRRARALNISKNVLQFVDFLQGQLI